MKVQTMALPWIALCVLAGCVTTTSTYDGPGVDPAADALLQKMSDGVMSMETFRVVTEERREELADGGRVVTRATTRQAVVARPASLYFESFGRGFWREGWYTDGQLLLADHEADIYIAAELPPTMNEALDYLAANIGVPMPMSDLLYDSPYEALMTSDTRGFHSGTEVVAGEPTDHLTFTNPYVDWEIWLRQGPLALPAKLAITYKNVAGSPRAEIVFRVWELNVPVEPAQFRAEPPANYDRIRIADIAQED